MNRIAIAIAMALTVTACGGTSWQDQLTDQIREEVASDGCYDDAALDSARAIAEGLAGESTLGDWGEDDRYPYIPSDTPMTEVLDITFTAIAEECGL